MTGKVVKVTCVVLTALVNQALCFVGRPSPSLPHGSPAIIGSAPLSYPFYPSPPDGYSVPLKKGSSSFLPYSPSSSVTYVTAAPITYSQPSLKPYFLPSPKSYFVSSPKPYFEPSPNSYYLKSPKPYFPPSPKPYFTPSPKSYFQSSPKPYFQPSLKHYFAPSPKPYFTPSPKSYFPSSPKPYLPKSPEPYFSPSPKPNFQSPPKPNFQRSPKSYFPSFPKPYLPKSPEPYFSPSPKPYSPPEYYPRPSTYSPVPPYKHPLTYDLRQSTPTSHHDLKYPVKRPQYAFSYGVADDSSGASYSHSEVRDGQETTGNYVVDLPDGRRQTVTYFDTGNGLMADVTIEGQIKHTPTYVAPPIFTNVRPDLPEYSRPLSSV
nr:extensin-2-like [Procambarus clarkii]